MRVLATGSWTFEIGSEFRLQDNGDSMQAVHGDRIVYVSSMRVEERGAPVSAEKIRLAAAKRLGTGRRVSHLADSVQGDAGIRLEERVWRLYGFMCANGAIANCVIDFANETEQPWAVAVWHSLRCTGSAA